MKILPTKIAEEPFVQRLVTGKGYVWLLARLRLWFERDVLALLRSGQRFFGVVG